MSASGTNVQIGRPHNPLFNDNKLKLGLFGVNVSNGCAITTIEPRHKVTWPGSLAIAKAADRYGYEALVPVARWCGFGGESNFNGTCFETYTWAAGLGQATENICILTTSHVPTIHPIVAAKQAATVDHITNGRFALNIVCGWFSPELEMFGVPQLEHDTRYDYAAEWIEIIKLLWSREKEFDYEGKFLHINKGFAMPKPLQQPFPALMNAGGSGKGRHFAAKYCDMAFVLLTSHNLEDGRAQSVPPPCTRGIWPRAANLGQLLRCPRRHQEGGRGRAQSLRCRKRRRASRRLADPSDGPAILGTATRGDRSVSVSLEGWLGRLPACRNRRPYCRSARQAQRDRLRWNSIELGGLQRRS